MTTFRVKPDGSLKRVPEGQAATRVLDNGTMKSMAMGCATKRGQAKRRKFFAKRGHDVKFHPKTGEMIFEGGFHTQKKLAKHSGLEVG